MSTISRNIEIISDRQKPAVMKTDPPQPVSTDKPQALPFRTVIGGHDEFTRAYFDSETVAVVFIDLHEWKDSDIEEQDLDLYYCQIMNRAWMSLIAAGHQVKEMKVYMLLEQEYGIGDDVFIDNWLGSKDEIHPIWPMHYGESIPNALSEISKTFDKDHLHPLKSAIFMLVTDNKKACKESLWIRLSKRDNILAAHYLRYHQSSDIPSLPTSTCIHNKLLDIYTQPPTQHFYKYRDHPEILPVERKEAKGGKEAKEAMKGKEAQEASTTGLPVASNKTFERIVGSDGVCQADSFLRFLERSADVYDRVI